jgi:hypothetical protein
MYTTYKRTARRQPAYVLAPSPTPSFLVPVAVAGTQVPFDTCDFAINSQVHCFREKPSLRGGPDQPTAPKI